MSVHGNLYDDDWDDPYPTPEGWRSHFKHLGGRELALGLYELLPGQTQCPYHFHYGNHEALVVLAGAPTLRTPDGERVLGAGDVEYFPAGPEFRLSNEVRALQEYKLQQQAAKAGLAAPAP